MGVGSSFFFELHISGAGTSLLAWSPSSTESGLVNPVSSWLTSSCCFGCKKGVLFSQLSVGELAANASSSFDTRVDSLPQASCTAFLPPSCSRLWLMGNRKFQCRVQLPLPHLWDVPHTLVGLDRAATLPHTSCSSHLLWILCWLLKVMTQTRTMSPILKATALLHLS